MTNFYPKANPELLHQKVGSEHMVYNPATGSVHLLQLHMANVLQVCEGKLTEQQMLEQLPGKTLLNRQELIKNIIDELIALGLVSPIDSDGGERPRTDFDRRAFLQAATVAASLPIVATVALPLPASASSACVTNCNLAQDGTPCDPDLMLPADCAAGAQCAVQFTCNGPADGSGCSPGACNTTDFANANKVCVANNGTFIQDSCSNARANALQPFVGSTQYTYICKSCPS